MRECSDLEGMGTRQVWSSGRDNRLRVLNRMQSQGPGLLWVTLQDQLPAIQILLSLGEWHLGVTQMRGVPESASQALPSAEP